jgi:site-specific recombinase XerD
LQYYVRKKPCFALFFKKTKKLRFRFHQCLPKNYGRRSPKEVSLKRSCDPERWSTDAGKALGNKEDARQLNSYLDTIRLKVQEARRLLIEENKPINALAIKNLLSGLFEDRKTVCAVFKAHNERMKELVGQQYSPRTLQRFETTLTHTGAFIQWKFKTADLDIRELNYEFIHDFEFWLKSIQKCNHNSSMKYLSNFKKIVSHCVRARWLRINPFEEFKLTKKEVIKEILTDPELSAIEAKELQSERLDLVRDIFLFSCYTGLAYADVKNLSKVDIKPGIDKQQWIFINRQKTETPSRIPVLPLPLKLMRKYDDHPKCLNTGKVFPTLSNQKMNSYLKEIADRCDIDKKLTCHTARHTFATTVTLSNGVPMETVADMLGHKSLKQTQHYAKLLDHRISNDMAALRLKLAPEKAPVVEQVSSAEGEKKGTVKAGVNYTYVIKG